MSIVSAQYVQDEEGQNSCIKLVLSEMRDNVPYILVPLANGNRYFQDIQEWVKEGNTIEEAD